MRKTQIGWIIIVAALFVVGLLFFQKQDSKTFIQIVVGTIALVVLFGTLTIKVTDEFVKFSFGIGLIYGKIKLQNIESCRSLNYIPLGWGIRFRPGVIIFNVSGYKAVEIKRKNKNWAIWIGASCPDEIAAYINAKLNNPKPSI